MKNIIEYLYNCEHSNPHKIFCVDSMSQYTYKQAFETVKKIACFLNNKNLINKPILLKAHRDNITLLTILGIIMSNNYYVPINPDYSIEKINSIIESSNAEHEIVFDDGNGNAKICFNYNDILSPNNSYDNLDNEKSNKENNLYIIYTSGSTGNPKGVIKTHNNMMSFIENFLATFKFKDNLNIANQTPLFFDASMKDIFLTLATCGTLYFPDKTLFAMPLKLIEYLNNNKINFICWVPSALTIIVRLNTFKYLKPIYLKYVFFVGEVFLPKYLNMWIKELPDIQYVNLYGSTELAGVCLYKRINQELPEDKAIPLGKPLYNNKVLLEKDELIILSDQIAKGYINNEEKNKQVFILRNNQKALRTGDYAEIDENNDFIFKSRKDFQIKHMGYRIELQEIEVAISSLAYIDNCVVLFNQQKDQLVLFAVLNKEIDMPNKIISIDLKNKLPTYMIPSKIEILDKLPLNANGKIDRVKLKEKIEE